MISLRVSPEDALVAFASVPHPRLQDAIGKYWHVDDDGVHVYSQSVCWLFCWANSDTYHEETAERAREAFSQLLTVSFEDFDRAVDLTTAQKYRYIEDRARVDAEMADAAQLPRLRALADTAGEQPLTRVQASFILSALGPLEASGVNVRAITDAQRIADPSARRRHLLRCRRALNDGARQAQQVIAAVKSWEECIIHAKALVASSISVLRAIIDERLGTPTTLGSA